MLPNEFLTEFLICIYEIAAAKMLDIALNNCSLAGEILLNLNLGFSG